MNASPLPEGIVRTLSRRFPSPPAPLPLFAALTRDGKTTNTVLLESAEPTSRRTQKSLLVVSSAVSFTCRGSAVEVEPLNSNGQSIIPYLRQSLQSLAPRDTPRGFRIEFKPLVDEESEERRLHADSPFSVLRAVIGQLKPETENHSESVLLVGLFAYDLVAHFERLPDPIPGWSGPGDDVPDFRFLLADQIVVIDHLKGHAEVLVNVFGGSNAEANYFSALDAVSRIARTAGQLSQDPASEMAFAALDRGPLDQVASDVSDADFQRVVESMQRHIVAGDVFQIVPSRTFSMKCGDALSAYAALRQLNPSPYLFFVNLGEFVLFGASPESAVKVDGPRRQVEISPIAGTRARGFGPDGLPDPDLDSRIEAELRLDEKENAEHMMLVDLARNDIARVSLHGTRRVTDLARVDRYSHVMHLVSRVQGELRDGLDALHAYQASMNMGTLTGAPKIKAMQLIRSLEGTRRGHYGGAVGYLRGDGSFDTAIVIRSALVQHGMAHVRAGAGVVHDSIPQAEADETRRKAEAVLRAIAQANAMPAGANSP